MGNRTFTADKGYAKELADVVKYGKQLDKKMAKKKSGKKSVKRK